jgi:hypothetical protein
MGSFSFTINLNLFIEDWGVGNGNQVLVFLIFY